MQNRAAVLHGIHDLRIDDVPVPEPGPREVLVEVRAIGVCGSDVHYYEHGRIGRYVVREPLILGHESGGVIVRQGPGATRHRIGQRVALEPGVPCGACQQCRSGRYNLCAEVHFFATPPVHGAFANYVAVHQDFAFPLPDSVSDDAGALIEPLSVGIWACRKARLQGGEHVLVTGAGPIGLLAMQAAVALGATRVTVTDVNPHRLELARRTGAARTVDLREQPLGGAGVEADVLLEGSGHPAALADGIRSLRPAGVAVAVGMGPGEEVTIPLALLQNRELTLTGTFRYANIYPTAIGLVAAGLVDVEAIVTGHYPLEEAEKALQASRQDPESVKAVVVPAGVAR
ncbi:MAG TPA: NAD(P)-dependent alcohol dehydrogenase [Actinomycetes bacterium]|nr:NAD(P)-dependent alcohol dehydrogenase [Actinomycetes bacterium]